MTTFKHTFSNTFILTLCFLLISFQFRLSPLPEPFLGEKYRLVICALFQDETFYLKEWIEFHRIVGVEHFYLYNNLSTDHYLEVLNPYIKEGVVDLIDWPVESRNQEEYIDHVQLPIYNHALANIKMTAEWAAFIDLDEFLVPVHYEGLVELLDEYRNFGGLNINWQLFGTSYIDELPDDELIIENLQWKAYTYSDGNKTVKLIVQPAHVKCIKNPHYFEFHEGFFAVDSNKTPAKINQKGQPIVIDQVRINHYWCGTRNWFINNKMPRRAKWGLSISERHLEALFTSFNQEKDDTIVKFVPQLKKIMFDPKIILNGS